MLTMNYRGKFMSLALAALTLTATASTTSTNITPLSGVPTKKTRPIVKALKRSDVSAALLKKAKPYERQHRRADGGDEYEITGDDAVMFNECVNLKTYNEDLFDEDYIDYAQNGYIIAARSYVIFQVCEPDYCSYEAEDNLFIVDLATWVQSTVEYFSNVKQNYCEACEQFEDYCNPQEEEEEEEEKDEEEEENDEEEEEDNDEEEDNEDRRLAKRQRKQKEKKYIDCDQCFDYGCYDEDEDGDADNGMDDEQLGEFIQGLAECQETGDQWNNMDIYAGLICSSYGDGIEVGAFLDEDCTMYTNQVNSYQTLYDALYNADGNNNNGNNNNNNGNANQDENGEDYYMERVETLLKLPFEEYISCDGDAYEFDDPDEEENGEEEEEEDDDEEKEVSEICQNLFDDDSSVSMENCGANGDEEEEEEEEEENDNQNYDWYSYDISQDNEDNMQAVCKVILNLGGEYEYVYDEEGSGSWYERDDNGNIVTGEASAKGSKGTIGKILIPILLVIIAAVAFFTCTSGNKKKSDPKRDPLYTGGSMA